MQALSQAIGNAYAAISEYLKPLGEHVAEPPYAAYFNMDMQDLDIELGLPINNPFPEKEKIIASEIPGGEFSASLHTGPNRDVKPTYNAVFQWMQPKAMNGPG